jgi:hypothetical protein
MAKKDKTPAQAVQLETLHLILNELKPVLARFEADPSRENEPDTFIRGIYAGYKDGLQRAIDIVNYEIGIRLDPPNINYPGERPQSAAALAAETLRDEKDLGNNGGGHA